MARASVAITAEDKLEKGLLEAKKSLMKFEQGVDKISKSISKAFGVASVTAGIIALKKAAEDCINEFAKVERVSLRMNAVWENVGKAIGKSASELEAYADSIEQTTYFTAESVKEAGLLLAATESLTEDGFMKALNASIDLAEALGTDVPDAASVLSKALQDPESSLSRLKSIGVTFTDSEKEMIKSLQDSGKEFEAQEVILNKVEQKYKGIAQAVASTPTNTLTQIGNTLGDIKEDLGQGLIYALAPAFDFILESLNKIKSWINSSMSNTAVISALKAGGDASVFSEEQLRKAREQASKNVYTPSSVAEAEMMAATGRSPWEDVIDLIDRELERRTTLSGDSSSQGGTVTAAQLVQNLTNNLESFFSTYGKESTSYQRASYEAVIAQAEQLKSQMEFFSDGTLTLLRSSVSELGLNSAEEVNAAYGQLEEIIAKFQDKIADLEPSVGPSDLENILASYGKQSQSWQIKEIDKAINSINDVYESADDEQKVYLDEILASMAEQKDILRDLDTSISTDFLENLGSAIGKAVQGLGGSNSTQAGNFGSAVVQSLVSNLGEAGEVAGKLATNMATMGPLLGAIATALEYVFQGLAETVGPILNEFVKLGIEPLKELGRIVGDLLIPVIEAVMPLVETTAEFLSGLFNSLGVILQPIIQIISGSLSPVISVLSNILQALMPVLKVFAKIVVTVTGTIQYVIQVLQHWVASIMNWLAGLNIFGWHPFGGLAMNDPGSPGSYSSYIQDKWASVDAAFNKSANGGIDSSTETALSSASYRGATQVTINIYQQAPVVGDGGMRDFAKMIKDEFDNLNYYGVTA